METGLKEKSALTPGLSRFIQPYCFPVRVSISEDNWWLSKIDKSHLIFVACVSDYFWHDAPKRNFRSSPKGRQYSAPESFILSG